MSEVKTVKAYVFVIQNSGERGYKLDRRYHLIGDATKDEIQNAISKHASEWKGWTPTGENQKPIWAQDLPAGEFTAYWMWK